MKERLVHFYRFFCSSYIWLGATALVLGIVLTAVSEVARGFFFPSATFWTAITAVFLQVWVLLGIFFGLVTIFISRRRAFMLIVASIGFAIPLFALWRVCGGC